MDNDDELKNSEVDIDADAIEEVTDDELLDKSKGIMKLNVKEQDDDEDDDDEDVVDDEEDIEDDDDEDVNAYVTDDDEDDTKNKNKKASASKTNMYGLDSQNEDMDMENADEDEDDDDEEQEEDEDYLKKFGKETKSSYLESYHPESYSHNFEEVRMLSIVMRDEKNNIIDPLHKTIPFMTKFEKARILGQRAKQLDSGAIPFVKVDKTIIDGYLIALKELEEKKIPFIIKRPLPNGAFEYWNVNDLELVC
jgi:DNA-directed RNA polymerase I, II, and III subunit RPABC2